MDPDERAEDSGERPYTARIPDFRTLTEGVPLQVDRENRKKAMRAKMLAKFPRLLHRRGI